MGFGARDYLKVAVFVAIIAGVASVVSVLLDPNVGLFPVRIETVLVLSAKENYAAGTVVTDPASMFELREVHKKDAPASLYSPDELGALRSRKLRTVIERGEILTSEHLQEE